MICTTLLTWTRNGQEDARNEKYFSLQGDLFSTVLQVLARICNLHRRALENDKMATMSHRLVILWCMSLYGIACRKAWSLRSMDDCTGSRQKWQNWPTKKLIYEAKGVELYTGPAENTDLLMEQNVTQEGVSQIIREERKKVMCGSRRKPFHWLWGTYSLKWPGRA